jgi:hypothetical protein
LAFGVFFLFPDHSPALQRWDNRVPFFVESCKDERTLFRPCGTNDFWIPWLPALKRWAILEEPERSPYKPTSPRMAFGVFFASSDLRLSNRRSQALYLLFVTLNQLGDLRVKAVLRGVDVPDRTGELFLL